MGTHDPLTDTAASYRMAARSAVCGLAGVVDTGNARGDNNQGEAGKMADMLKRLGALALLVSVVGVFTLGGGLAYGDGDDDDDGDDTVTVQFGESEGVNLLEVPPPDDHHVIVDPGPIDEDTTVFFNINQSALPFGGIHQVIIFEVETLDTDVPADFNEETEEGLFIYPDSTGEAPLDPSQDPLPQGPPRVIAAGQFGSDFATFDELKRAIERVL